MWVARGSSCEEENGDRLGKGSSESTVGVIKCWAGKLRFHQMGCEKPLSSPQWRRDQKNVIIYGSFCYGLQKRLKKNESVRKKGWREVDLETEHHDVRVSFENQ